MRVLVQRCKRGQVTVDNQVIGKINQGLMLLVGFTEGDNSSNIDYLVDKVINLRIFDDENGVMNKSLLDIQGSILSVSQFTLYADASKGRRPSYAKALPGKYSQELYNEFNKKIHDKGVNIETGKFGAEMLVDFVNDGPITILLEK